MPSPPSEDLARQLGVTLNPEPAVQRIGDRFIFTYDELGLSLELARVELDRSQGHGLLRVRTTLPGHDAVVMHDTRFNITSARERSSTARYLKQRVDLDAIRGVSWESVLERVCGEALRAVRDGAATVTLGTLPRSVTQRYALLPAVLHNDRTGIYGDAGTGKSTIALAWGVAYKTGLPLAGVEPTERGNVLLADFETDAQTAQWRLDSIVRGAGLTDVHLDGAEADCLGRDDCPFPHIEYMRCDYPLVEMDEAIERVIAVRDIGLVIVDSLTFATEGSAKDEDAVIPMFNAMRRWGCSVLFVDHVTIGQDGKEQTKPYGSRFKRNAARLLWHIRSASAEQGESLSVGLYADKANYGGRMPDIGLRLSYYHCGEPTAGADLADEIRLTAEDPRDAPEQRPHLSQSTQILLVLREARESLTVDDIAERTGIKRDTVKARLNDLKKNGGRVVDFTANGVQAAKRWALASHHNEDEAR